jgi:S1-C subfamily serine protease
VVPIEAAEKVRKDFVRFHEVRPGWVGVHVKTLPEAVSGSTAYVEEVIPESPAEKAGIRGGDVLLEIGGLRITSLEDMFDASFFLSADDEVVLRVAREGSEREFSVVPSDHPDRPRLPELVGEPPAPTLQMNR